MYVVLNGTLNVSRAAVFASTGRSESHQEEILLNKIEEGGYIGEEILFPAYANKYLYTVRVESFDCKLLAFEKPANGKDYSTNYLTLCLEKNFEKKEAYRKNLLERAEKKDPDKLLRILNPKAIDTTRNTSIGSHDS